MLGHLQRILCLQELVRVPYLFDRTTLPTWLKMKPYGQLWSQPDLVSDSEQRSSLRSLAVAASLIGPLKRLAGTQ
jgi:hypothetical protein